ncbi:MAG TPA: hypothetical protein VFB72_12260 [Verrucomicrobiae bacterium]|nr:hypothetical protein [Verrucomicrobiae bacterium]
MKERKRWLTVVAYAIGMAWVESAAVFYLRLISDRIDPHQTEPLPPVPGLASVELVREAATLLMLFTVGMLAGKNWRSRWGYAAIAFGVWDIFYYVFLKVITGWPNSLIDWDILFLLPLPWWGPVIAPVLIASLMVLWGTLASQWEHQRRFRDEWRAWGLNFAGCALALYVFMEDAIRIVGKGEDAMRMLLPSRFDWPLFIIALVLMSAPVYGNGRHIRGVKISQNNLNQGTIT